MTLMRTCPGSSSMFCARQNTNSPDETDLQRSLRRPLRLALLEVEALVVFVPIRGPGGCVKCVRAADHCHCQHSKRKVHHHRRLRSTSCAWVLLKAAGP